MPLSRTSLSHRDLLKRCLPSLARPAILAAKVAVGLRSDPSLSMARSTGPWAGGSAIDDDLLRALWNESDAGPNASTAWSRNRMQGAIRLMARKLKTYRTSLGFFEQA